MSNNMDKRLAQLESQAPATPKEDWVVRVRRPIVESDGNVRRVVEHEVRNGQVVERKDREVTDLPPEVRQSVLQKVRAVLAGKQDR